MENGTMHFFKSWPETEIQFWVELKDRGAETVHDVCALINQGNGHDKTYFIIMFKSAGPKYKVLGLYGKNGGRLNINPIYEGIDVFMAGKEYIKMKDAKMKKGYEHCAEVSKKLENFLHNKLFKEGGLELEIVEQRLASM